MPKRPQYWGRPTLEQKPYLASVVHLGVFSNVCKGGDNEMLRWLAAAGTSTYTASANAARATMSWDGYGRLIST